METVSQDHSRRLEIHCETRLVSTNHRTCSSDAREPIIDGVSERRVGSSGTHIPESTHHVTMTWNHLRATSLIGRQHDIDASIEVFDDEKRQKVANVLVRTEELPVDHEGRVARLVSAFGSTIRYVVSVGDAPRDPFILTVSDRPVISE